MCENLSRTDACLPHAHCPTHFLTNYHPSTVTMEKDARVSYMEMVTSAKEVEMYVLKGGYGASGEYSKVGGQRGRPAVDHPYKYHYKFTSSDLPDIPVALVQLRLTPHEEGAREVYLFRLSVLVGEANSRHRSNISRGIGSLQDALTVSGNGKYLSGYSSTSTSMVPMSTGRRNSSSQGPQQGQYGSSGVVATRNNENQVVTAGSGAEGAVVADALNDVMGKMLTVVSRKTKGYVGSTYKKTEDKISARMKSIEARISGFEEVVGQNLERRLLDLEHVMATLNERISPKVSPLAPEGKKQGQSLVAPGKRDSDRSDSLNREGGVEESKDGYVPQMSRNQQLCEP